MDFKLDLKYPYRNPYAYPYFYGAEGNKKRLFIFVESIKSLRGCYVFC